MFLKQNARSGQPASTPLENVPPNLQSPAADGPALRASPALMPSHEPGHLGEEIGKRLIVGDGIRLKGEITACDRLVVEGHVEVTLNETRMLEIKPSGRFIGSCEVEEAQISGVYDGDLTVRGRLIVHASGKVTGKIHYGELELERGGRIAGELSVRERETSGIKSKPAFHGKNAA
jgi:cytoskeletal protein CcmA (bactofilin family)